MKLLINIIITLVFTLMMSSGLSAVDLKPSPIQDKFDLLINYSSSDEFDDLNKSDNKEIKNNHENTGNKKHSLLKAGLYSALLPGLGERYVGHKTKAKYFFAAEAMIWLGYFTFDRYASWREDDYIRYASEHANANLEGKDEEFQDLVGFYSDIDQYNSLGRVSDRDRPYLANTPENHWRWESDEARLIYREIKNKSSEYDRRAQFMIGAAVANRIVSIIDAVRDARRSNRSMNDSFSNKKRMKYKLAFNPMSKNKQVNFSVYPPFL